MLCQVVGQIPLLAFVSMMAKQQPPALEPLQDSVFAADVQFLSRYLQSFGA
jgi:hypothetical protein